MKCLRFLVVPFLIYSSVGLPAQRLEVPILQSYVTDLTKTLSSSQRQNLELRLRAFKDSTTIQIAVLIIPSLGGENLEDFSIRVAEKNKFGSGKRNTGVILLVVKQEGLVRIEVGYGLEGILTDAIADKVIREIIRPRFRENDYYTGILQGVSTLMGVARGEYSAVNEVERVSGSGELGWVVFLVIFFGGMVLVVLSRFARVRRYVGSSRGWGYYPSWGGCGSTGSGVGFGGGFSGGGSIGGGGSFGGGGASGSW